MEGSKKGRRVWSREKIEEVLQDITENNLTQSSASRKYGIPQTTISDKVLGISSLDATPGRPPSLSKEEEDSLVFYIKYRTERGFPITKKTILALAQAVHVRYCEENDAAPKISLESGLSQKWWKGFKGRHDLTIRKPDPLDRGRRDAIDREVVKDFFTLLSETMAKNGLDGQPHRVYNADETGFELDPQRKKVVSFAKMNAPATSVRKGTRDHITSMECVAANGTALPPMIIFSKSYPSTAYSLDGPDNAVYATTPSGFIEADIFLSWLDKCFNRFSSPERPVLLLLDQHSTHVTTEAIDFAIKNDIILMGLPPHSSHFLQPLDAQGGPFNRMKDVYEDVVNDVTLVRPNYFVTKSSFSKIYKIVREKTLSMEVIKTGFRKTGVYPVDEDAVNERWLVLNEVHTEQQDGCEAERQLLQEEVEMLDLAEIASQAKEDEEAIGHEAAEKQLLPEELEMLELADEMAQSTNRNPVKSTRRAANDSTLRRSTCRACGARLDLGSANPFVQAGVVAPYVSDLLTPIPEAHTRRARRIKPKALVFDEEYVATLKREADEKEERKRKEKLRKKKEREEKKKKKMEELANMRKEKLEIRQKLREEKQKKKMEELENKRQERLQIRQKRREEALKKKKKAGTEKKTSSQGRVESGLTDMTPVGSGQQTPTCSGQRTPTCSGQRTPTCSGQRTPTCSGQETPVGSGQQTSNCSGHQTPVASVSGLQTPGDDGHGGNKNRPRRKALVPYWMTDFTTESWEDD
ncbi:uncharacterized protein LOC144869927 [Branchiostoma floridae x Branchiostoma japonicum]